MPQHGNRKPGNLQGRREDLQRQQGHEPLRHAFGKRGDVIGLGDDEGNLQEMRDRERDAARQAAVLELLVG